jgi:hypothetical protein
MEMKEESTKGNATSRFLLIAIALAGTEVRLPSAFKNLCVFAVDNL